MLNPRKSLFALLAIWSVALCASASAWAEAPSPGFTLDSFVSPTHFSESETASCLENIGYIPNEPGYDCDSYQVTATNAGSEPTDGSPVTLVDTLPEGEELSIVEIQFNYVVQGGTITTPNLAREDCGSEANRVVRCTFHGVVEPDARLQMFVSLTVDKGASGSLTNTASVSGGGAAPVSTHSHNEINATPAAFGPSNFEFYKAGLDGAPETQAGGHPYELITTIDSNTDFRQSAFNEEVTNVEDIRDIVVDLPLGFVGSTLSAPQCTEEQLSAEAVKHSPEIGGCPPDTQIGYLATEQGWVNSPIYNMVPEHGYPAEFGYVDSLDGAHVFYTRVVPTPAGYVLQTSSLQIPEINLHKIIVTFYGDPVEKQAEIHQHRIEAELREKGVKEPHVEREHPEAQVPFFTNPTSCSNGPQVATLWMDSWGNPARVTPDGFPIDLEEPEWKKMQSVSPAVTGCDALKFTPELVAQPTTHEADSPSGLEFEAKLTQSESFGVPATPALRDLTVTFPEGMTVDPSSADGLGVCSEAQIGWLGQNPVKAGELFDFSEAEPQCPESSKIGSLELESPLLPGKLYGEVFLAAQDENPFQSTFAIYVVVNDPVTGVVIKVAGELRANPTTGQLTGVFDENPQLPFSVLDIHFFGGPRAELTTPLSCGIYTTSSEMEPWSAPDSGPIGSPFDDYAINEGCQVGFKPAFTGGSTNLQAGAYTTFQASFSREDDDQELAGLTVNLPPGSLADVAGVPECSEAQIRETEQTGVEQCPAASQVGTVRAGAGPGPNPLFVPGKVYFTGPYNGGPFGLAVVVPAKPGPFDFGLVVVRQSLRINPITSAVTDVSDPFPTRLDPVAPNGRTTGIPIRLRRVDVEIDRPGFVFNPTDCGRLQVSGSITSTQGQSSTLAVPFQVTNCATLGFKPTLSVSASSKSSRADGTSVTFKIAYPKDAQGKETWLSKAKFDIPKQLPARLTTLQKSCTAATFDANPANCPGPSKIGTALVHTQLLPVPLQGPVIFVSNGAAKFPEAVLVLQGDGVTVEVHGETFIDEKTGVTSATFSTIPGVPFEEVAVTLPSGPYSEFTATSDLCDVTKTVLVKRKVTVKNRGRSKTVTRKVEQAVAGALQMPTAFVAQNGAEIHVNTPIEVTGCGAKKKRAKTSRHPPKREAKR